MVCGYLGKQTVEIKCPYKHRDEMLAEVIDKNFHIDANLKLKRKHDFSEPENIEIVLTRNGIDIYEDVLNLII